MVKAKKSRMKSHRRTKLKRYRKVKTFKPKPVYKSSDTFLDIFIKTLFK